MMKSKNPKIQKILLKGLAIYLAVMIVLTPLVYAATSLDDSYIEGTIIEKLLYGEVGSTVKGIEEYFTTNGNTTLYIKNETQLRALAEYVNNGNNCDGKKIKLLNDIKVNNNEEWVPIGKDGAPFKGEFDGRGYKISGIKFSRENKLYSEISNIGLFGYVEKGTNTIIKNVTLADSKFDITYNLSTDTNLKINTDTDFEIQSMKYSNLGGIVGYSKNISIENCNIENSVNINGAENVGGIVGKTEEGTIKNCSNEGTITGVLNIGGIVGYNIGDKSSTNINKNTLKFSGNNIAKVLSSKNSGIIYALVGNAGGIVGSQINTAIVQKCENKGAVSISSTIIYMFQEGKSINIKPSNAGGIVGKTTSEIIETVELYSAIDGSINDGPVSGYKNIGGIVGRLASMGTALVDGTIGGSAILSNCINYNSNITASNENNHKGYLAGNIDHYLNENEKTNNYVIIYNNLFFVTYDIAFESNEVSYSRYDNNNDANISSKEEERKEFNNTAKKAVGIRNKEEERSVTNKLRLYDDGFNIILENKFRTSNENKYWMLLPKLDNDLQYQSVRMADFSFSKNTEYSNENNDVFNQKLFMFYPIDTEGSETTTVKISNEDDFVDNKNIDVYVDKNEQLYYYNSDTGRFEISNSGNSSNEINTNEINTKVNVNYIISKRASGDASYNIVNENTYFKEGDIIKITAEFDKYLASTYGPLKEISTAPTLKLNNSITMTPGKIYTTVIGYKTTIEYTYTVQAGDNVEITSLDLSELGTIYAISGSDYGTNHPIITATSISTPIEGLVLDTIAPIVKTTVYVENKLETGRYTAGKEIIIETTTSEAIQDDYINPKVQVNFSESGLGKYNYDTESNPATVGYAKCKNARINSDGTTTWTYLYQIQERDEGNLQLEYKEGEIIDLAGNATNIKNLYTPQTPTSSNISGVSWNNELGVTYEFYKNSVSEENRITSNNYLTTEDDLIIVATFDKVLYVHYGLSNGKNTNVRLNNTYKNRAPSLYLNGYSNLKNTSATVSTKYDSTVITYTFDIKKYDLSELTKVDKLILKNENNVEAVTTNGTTVTTNGLIPFAAEWYSTYQSEDESKYKTISSKAITTTTGIENIVLDPIGVSNNIKQDDIYADTTAPTVEITAQKLDGTSTTDIVNNITNANVIRYTFKWREEVIGFTADDITVNNGTKEKLSDPTINADGTYSYTMEVTTNTEKGNIGNIQVIVEQNACQDLVGHSNVRTESVIRVDKKSPILSSLEAYATSDVALGDSINDVKENYKTGDTVTIVATFDENIENTKTVPSLALQFSESGNAKGTISAGIKEGNKITYTYKIVEGDSGTLSVKGFSGTVVDSAGNETKVTKRALDGDTIIVDSESPKIIGITAIAPDFEYDQFVKNNEEDTEYLEGETKRYGIGKQIKFLVEFNEEIYYLDNNKKIEKIVSETAPKLKIRFGAGATRYAVFSKVDGKMLEYTYDIQSEDNGNLSLVSMSGTISDIAGNSIANHSLVTLSKYEDTIAEENKVDNIMADTTSSTVKLKVTKIENDGLIGTQNHYKAGNILTITATTNEYVYKKSGNNLSKITSESAPTLGIKFGGESSKGNIKCTKVDYVYKENTKTIGTIFTYEYVITTGDNGEISLSFGEKKYYDIALNSNVEGTKDSSSKPVIADTIAPNTSHLQGTSDNSYIRDNENGTYSVLFTEKLYYLNNNVVTALTNNNVVANGPKLTLKNASGEFTEIVASSINSDGTELTYTAESGQERIGISSYNKICDVAGNMYNSQVKIAPTLLSIKITSPEDNTVKYRTDTEVTIVATFTKRVQGTVPTLKIKFGKEGTEKSISSGTIDKDTITYQYKIQEGDNGTLSIVSLEGNGLRGEDGTLYESPEKISLTGRTITADTIKPTVMIKAYTDYKTSSKKEVSGKINAEVTTYEFTWDENVVGFEAEDINVINGIKGTFTKVSDAVYTLDVINSNEGVQTVTVPSEVCTDIAKIGRYDKETGKYIVENIGNPNESGRIQAVNTVEIDVTAPSVRFIIPNGGNYTTTTDSRTEESTGTATLKTKIEINENISAFKYRIVKVGETAPEYTTISANQINSSDIDITIKNVTVGEYVLEVIAIDEAGNERQAKSNKYKVTAGAITLTPNTTEKTKDNITVNIEYSEALTENRKAGIQGKTQSADATTVIIGENGTVYAEATDIAGNKVYATLKITNIDKTESTETDTPPVEDDIVGAEVIFEDLTTIQKDGIKYVKVSPTYTTEMLTAKMDAKALAGKTVEYTKLTSDGTLKTGSEISIEGETKYIIIVKGDVNCDGKVDFLNDIVMINNYRIGINKNLSEIQILAGDINNSGTIEFIPDIVAMNNYRLGRIEVL